MLVPVNGLVEQPRVLLTVLTVEGADENLLDQESESDREGDRRAFVVPPSGGFRRNAA